MKRGIRTRIISSVLALVMAICLCLVVVPKNALAATKLDEGVTVGSGYYTLELEKTSLVKFYINEEGGVDIYDQASNHVYEHGTRVSFFLRSGTYDVHLSSYYHSSNMEYVVEIEDVKESFPIKESFDKNNDTAANATTISELDGTTLTGVLSLGDDYDWYKFTLNAKTTLTMNLQEKTSDMKLIYELQNNEGTKVADNKSNSGVDGKYTFKDLAAGTYRLRLSKEKNTGIYNFSLSVPAPGVSYQAYVSGKKWLSTVKNGAMAGTVGQSRQLQGFRAKLTNATGNIEYCSYVQKKGWLPYVKNWAITGKPANNLRMEAVKIKLSGTVSKTYNVYYRTYVQKFGWLGWAKNGATSGSMGYGYRVESLQIKLVKKTATQPTSKVTPYKKK